MDNTENFGLNLPAETDYAMIEPLNENFRKLDAEVFAREALLRSAAAKNILVALDKIPVVDSADESKTKLITLQLLQTTLAAAFDKAYAALDHSHAWSAITGVPGTFPPSSHTHAAADIASGALAVARGGTGNTAVDTTPTSGSTKMVTSGGLYTALAGKLGTGDTAAAATKLATARTIRTNLASTATASFNGTANVTPGVTGILPVANGGTGVSSLAALVTALSGQGVAKIATGSYVGTGTYGASNPCSLTFDFPPKLVMVLGPSANSNGVANSSPLYCCATFACEALQSTYQERGYVSFDVVSGGGANAYAKLSGNTLSWYSVSARYQLNARATNYYICIG